MDTLDRQLRFVLEADRLKTVLRQTRITDGSRQENSAEHSWHLALMALALAGHAPPGTDLPRVMAMLVLHDLVEIDAGDLFLYSPPADHARQEAAERAAADRLYALLPAAQAAELRALWEEFEARQTPEARFARALDRLQPMLINMATGGGTWRSHGVTAGQVLARVALIEDGSPSLGACARRMIASAVRQGLLAPSPEGGAGAGSGQGGARAGSAAGGARAGSAAGGALDEAGRPPDAVGGPDGRPGAGQPGP